LLRTNLKKKQIYFYIGTFIVFNRRFKKRKKGREFGIFKVVRLMIFSKMRGLLVFLAAPI